MNDREQFEKCLERQPLRDLPPVWRNEILSAARKGEVLRHRSLATRHGFLSTLNRQLSTFLWPHPRAWAGLAAVWIVILAVNVAIRDDLTTATGHQIILPPLQMRERLREQEQLLAELFEPPPAIDRTKARVPRPQSFYRNEFLSG